MTEQVPSCFQPDCSKFWLADKSALTLLAPTEISHREMQLRDEDREAACVCWLLLDAVLLLWLPLVPELPKLFILSALSTFVSPLELFPARLILVTEVSCLPSCSPDVCTDTSLGLPCASLNLLPVVRTLK